MYGTSSLQHHSTEPERLGRKPEEYDQIITGDLGYIGQQILLDLLEKKGIRQGKITKIVEF